MVGDLTVRVAHRLEPVDASPGLVRVVYAIEAKGPGAAEIGPMICADFPEVIAALIARAEAEVGTVL